MRKLILLIALMMLPAIALAAGFGGLLGTDEPLPDPADVLGLNPTLFEEEVQIGDMTYTSFAYPMPADMNAFMRSYGALADKAGYTVTESSVPQPNGKQGPFAYCVSNGAKKAYIVPDHLGCMLVIVDNRIEFEHMPTPVPTAPPTPPPTPTPAYVPAPDNGGSSEIDYPPSPGRHLEYQQVKVDCPSCYGGKCSVCNGSGTYRNYGAAVPCDRYCSSCNGLGYFYQSQPVWVYD